MCVLHLDPKAEKSWRISRCLLLGQVRRIVTGRNGLLTGPAMALLVRRKQALGGILITAPNHNAGPEGYLGFKFVLSDGSMTPWLK